MSFIHYLFLGHFEHDGEVVRFSKSAGDSTYRPVVRQPIETETIKSLLKGMKRGEADALTFPDDWMMWLQDGYLICDKYMRNQEAIDFVVHLVEQTHCELHDVAAHCDVTLHEWLAVTHSHAISPTTEV